MKNKLLTSSTQTNEFAKNSKQKRVTEYVNLTSYSLKEEMLNLANSPKGRQITPKEIMERFGISNSSIHLYFRELVESGCLDRCSRGVYMAGDNTHVPLSKVEERREILFRYFRSCPNEIVRSKDLAKFFKVSDRTIRNDIVYNTPPDMYIETVERYGFRYIVD